MKLASRRDGRDGALIVVSKDTKKAVDATHIAKTMQAALDDWDNASVALEALYNKLIDLHTKVGFRPFPCRVHVAPFFLNHVTLLPF